MTEKQICQMALDVQNASNLSGVAHSFARILGELRNLPAMTGNKWLHAHPASVLFADKIASLCNCQDLGTDVVMAAYREVYKIVDAREDSHA